MPEKEHNETLFALMKNACMVIPKAWEFKHSIQFQLNNSYFKLGNNTLEEDVLVNNPDKVLYELQHCKYRGS